MSVPLTEPSVSTVTVELAVAAFLESLAGKSPRTRVTYASALRRLLEHLEAGGIEPASTPAEQLPPDLLERFYGWLVRAYGQERRFTLQTYTAAARAFFRYLMRRRLGPSDTSFEEAKAGLQEVMGRSTYLTPRIDHRL